MQRRQDRIFNVRESLFSKQERVLRNSTKTRATVFMAQREGEFGGRNARVFAIKLYQIRD